MAVHRPSVVLAALLLLVAAGYVALHSALLVPPRADVFYNYFGLAAYYNASESHCGALASLIDANWRQMVAGWPKRPVVDNGTDPVPNTTVLVVTPTHRRHTQKADLTKLAQALYGVDRLVWIVVEDAPRRTELVRDILARFAGDRLAGDVMAVHLALATPTGALMKGMPQRSAALELLRCLTRHGHSPLVLHKCRMDGDEFESGWPGAAGAVAACRALQSALLDAVVYFADDDNVYDRRVFTERVRTAKGVGVWPVGFAGGYLIESPRLDRSHKHVIGWETHYRPQDPFAVDMAGFAVSFNLFMRRPAASFDRCATDETRPESCLLLQLGVTLDQLEPMGFDSGRPHEVLVWHVKSSIGAHNGGGYRDFVL